MEKIKKKLRAQKDWPSKELLVVDYLVEDYRHLFSKLSEYGEVCNNHIIVVSLPQFENTIEYADLHKFSSQAHGCVVIFTTYEDN